MAERIRFRLQGNLSRCYYAAIADTRLSKYESYVTSSANPLLPQPEASPYTGLPPPDPAITSCPARATFCTTRGTSALVPSGGYWVGAFDLHFIPSFPDATRLAVRSWFADRSRHPYQRRITSPRKYARIGWRARLHRSFAAGTKTLIVCAHPLRGTP